MPERFYIHSHLKARMNERGISSKEIQKVLNEGWPADDAKTNTFGKVLVFPYNKKWGDRYYKKKEVTVYYKIMSGEIILLPVKARYGDTFLRP